jgi:hypothetical protein
VNQLSSHLKNSPSAEFETKQKCADQLRGVQSLKIYFSLLRPTYSFLKLSSEQFAGVRIAVTIKAKLLPAAAAAAAAATLLGQVGGVSATMIASPRCFRSRSPTNIIIRSSRLSAVPLKID